VRRLHGKVRVYCLKKVAEIVPHHHHRLLMMLSLLCLLLPPLMAPQ
jgi:hypothetical protein